MLLRRDARQWANWDANQSRSDCATRGRLTAHDAGAAVFVYGDLMPPRFAYWTIILDGTPTSFRAREQAELLPTFNQLKKKDPGAIMKWFSGGTLWDSPEQASEKRRLERERLYHEARAREERAREGRPVDQRPGDPQPGGERPRDERRRDDRRPPAQSRDGRPSNERRPDDRRPPAQSRDGRPSNDRPRDERPHDKQTSNQRGPVNRPGSAAVDRKPRTAPRPRSAAPGTGVPRRSKGWRPGGDHRDPKDKYKLPPGEARKRWKRRNLGPAKPKP